MGGHMVTGHVDGVAEIVSVEQDGDMAVLTFRVPRDYARFIAAKGSVALDGTSLTVNRVGDDWFNVQLIPHTLAVTTWGGRKAGDSVNFEVDLMARYVARLNETRPG
jgi:riboflavin synthase